MRAALPAGGCGSSSAAMLFHCSMVADELLRQLSILVGGFLCRHCLARRTAAAVAPPVTPLVTDRRVYWWEGVGGGRRRSWADITENGRESRRWPLIAADGDVD